MLKRIALIEKEEEVEYLIKNESDIADIYFIVLEPFPIRKLKENNLHYSLIEDFFDTEELFSKAAVITPKIISEVVSKIDSGIRIEYKYFEKYGLSLLKYHNYYLTILFDGIYSRIFILDKLISALQPQEVICFNRKVGYWSSAEFPWHPEETIWCQCLPIIKKQKDFRIKVIDEEVPLLRSKRSSHFSKIYFKYPLLYNLASIYKKRGLLNALKYHNKRKIAIVNYGYQWKYSECDFEKRGLGIFKINTYQNNKTEKGIKDYLSGLKYDAAFKFDGYDLYPLFQNKINNIIHNSIRYFIDAYKKNSKIFKNNKISAVGFSVLTVPEGWVILKAAQNNNVPIFCWGHGASGQAKFTKQYRNELLIADYYLAQGEGSTNTYQSYLEYKLEIKSVGFPTLDNLVENYNNEGNEFIKYDYTYVTTNYNQNNYYASFYPNYSDNQLYKVQKTILEKLSKYNVRVLFKDAGGGIYKSVSDYLHYPNITIEKEKYFIDLLKLSGAFIIDVPTTTLLEALTTNKPIFVLTQFIDLNEHAESLLKKRAVCCTSVDTLIARLDDYHNSGLYEADILNAEYLQAYGNFLNDGKSMERGINTIADRINQ